MRILFIGGTGNISTACVARALDLGHHVTVFHRGKSQTAPDPRIHEILGDRFSAADLASAANNNYDLVADFCAYKPNDVDMAASAFMSHTSQYIFISSVAAYERPGSTPFVTEDRPLRNPVWPYAQDKADCEARLATYTQAGLPTTVVRPGYTYGETWIPAAVGGHNCAVLHRIREGKPVISHGDGLGLITLTHNSDFAAAFMGLAGNAHAIGEAVHIMSNEYLTWDQVYTTLAEAAGCGIELLHIPSDYIDAIYPDWGERILGEKSYSLIFDMSKLHSLVPDFESRIPFAEGIRQSVAWHDAQSKHCAIDKALAQRMDLLAERFISDRKTAIHDLTNKI